MNVINKVKEYIKSNKLYIFVMIVGMLAFCIQTKFVILYADDMSLGIIAKNGTVLDAFKHLGENYMNWGGGPTPLIAILFMKFPLKIWKLFSCILMFFTVVISTKLVHYMSKLNKGVIAAIIWSFVNILNIWVSRETLYWLDGHLAYVLTAFQLLLYFYYLHSRLIMNVKIKKYDYVLLPLVAFFSGWSGPQTAVLTVIMSIFLVLWKIFIKKEKIELLLKISIGFSVLGFLVEVLAPGNSARMIESFPEFAQYGIIQKIGYRVDSVYSLIFNYFNDYGLGSLAFFSYMAFGMLAVISLKLADKEENIKLKNAIKISSIFVICFIAIILLARLNLINQEFFNLITFKNLLNEFNNNTFSIRHLIAYGITTIIMVIACLQSLYISLKQKNSILVTIFISALIAQGVMVVSPYSPLRSTFFTIFLLWIVIAYLIQLAYEEKIEINYIIITVLGIMRQELAVTALIIYLIVSSIFKGKGYKEIIITLSIFSIFAIENWTIVTKNYKINEQIYYENVTRIEQFIDNNSQETKLELLGPYDFKYGFNKFVGIEWIEDAVKQYFGLDLNVELIEEKTK